MYKQVLTSAKWFLRVKDKTVWYNICDSDSKREIVIVAGDKPYELMQLKHWIMRGNSGIALKSLLKLSHALGTQHVEKS